MLDRLLRWWRSRTHPTLSPVKVPAYSADEKRQLLIALATHPGFELLIAELHNRRVRFSGRPALRTVKSMDDMIHNTVEQARWDEARFWSGWLEDHIHRAIQIDDYLKAIPSDEQVPASTPAR